MNKMVLGILVCGLLASAYHTADAGEPTSQPAENPDVVQWRMHSDLDDGRRFISDGGLLLESQYLPKVPIPEKSVAPQGVQRLLQSETDHEFGLNDLDQKSADGHYLAPGGIQLSRKYIECLRGSPLKPSLRFRAKGPNEPVLILDAQ